MIRHKVLKEIRKTCPHCNGKDLWLIGFFRVDTEDVYVMLQCNNEDCGKTYPLNMDDVMMELFPRYVPTGSKLVN